jgi:hypothetical protein
MQATASGRHSWGSRGRRFTSDRQGWFWAPPAEDPAGQDGSPGRRRPPAGCPAASSGRCFGRSSPPLAGPVQPSFGPLGLNSSPNPRIKAACPGRARRSTCADATRGCPEAHLARRCGRCSSHESSPRQRGRAGSVTVSDGGCLGRTRAHPPLWAVLPRSWEAAHAAQIGTICVLPRAWEARWRPVVLISERWSPRSRGCRRRRWSGSRPPGVPAVRTGRTWFPWRWCPGWGVHRGLRLWEARAAQAGLLSAWRRRTLTGHAAGPGEGPRHSAG